MRCLCCYRLLDDAPGDFHATCSKKMFGQAIPPLVPYHEEQMEELATKVIQSRMTVTGI